MYSGDGSHQSLHPRELLLETNQVNRACTAQLEKLCVSVQYIIMCMCVCSVYYYIQYSKCNSSYTAQQGRSTHDPVISMCECFEKISK